MLSYRTVRKRKKPASEITLQEHMESIASRGGKARAEKLSPKRKSAIARKGGKAGGAARAASLTPEKRAEIARKAAKARWGKRS
jgi:general stress protein YciG